MRRDSVTTIRQDAWSTDEDLILAEVVLRHIREGSTQLSAFEEVGERLSRTSAACGFRWNSAIRKKYQSAVALAKKQRSKGKKAPDLNVSSWREESSEELSEVVAPVSVIKERQLDPQQIEEIEENPGSLTMEKVLSFLREYHENRQSLLTPIEMEELKNENEQLRRELEKERKEKRVMAEDYRTLLSIMDRARQMSLYEHAHES